MIIAEVTSYLPLRTKGGNKSRNRFETFIEIRATTTKEMRGALKIPAKRRPMFRILGLSTTPHVLERLALQAA